MHGRTEVFNSDWSNTRQRTMESSFHSHENSQQIFDIVLSRDEIMASRDFTLLFALMIQWPRRDLQSQNGRSTWEISHIHFGVVGGGGVGGGGKSVGGISWGGGGGNLLGGKISWGGGGGGKSVGGGG